MKSQKYFLNPSDQTQCIVHQVADTSTSGSGTPAVQCASGKVTAPAQSTGVTCDPDNIQPGTKLYATLEACCKANVPWDEDNCKYESRGTSAPGTLEFYIDWTRQQCVQNCNEAPGTSCGGIAKKWQPLYSTKETCCKHISWIATSKCVFHAPSPSVSIPIN